MKLKTLLVSAVALLCSAASWAQTWEDVTSFFITNAAVGSTTGWTDGAVANDASWEGRPDNVCLNHGWNTGTTTMYQPVSLQKGKYKLSAMTRGHANVSSNIYVYNTSTSSNLASAEINKNGDSGADNGWGKTTTGEFTLASDMSLQIGWWCDRTNTGNTQRWANCDYFQLYRECSESDPFVLATTGGAWSLNSTPWVSGATFSYNDETYVEHFAYNTPTGDYLKYTYNDVPNGYYQVKLTAKSSSTSSRDSGSGVIAVTDGDTKYTSIIAGDVEVAIPSYNATDATTGASPAQYTLDFVYVSNNKLEVTIKINEAGPNWVIAKMDGIKYYGDIANRKAYRAALAAAQEAIDDASYASVTGTERTELLAEINAATPANTEAYGTAATALTTKTSAFTSAKTNYEKFDTEKTNALLMGVDAGDVVRPVSGSNADLLTAMRALYVLEDAAATSGYTLDATNIFGTWTKNDTGTASGEHWSGDGRSYLDANWNRGYTMSVTNTVTLPAGHYVFKAAARAAADGVNGAFNMSVKIGSNDAVYKHYNAQGNTGKGIDTSGAANYGEGTFANSNNGRGWEWRLFAFDLAEETSVQMQIYAQILANKWVSFSDITLLTTDDNIGICEMMWEKAIEEAEAARDNSDYDNITGKERTDLVAAITAAASEPSTSAGYQTQEAALLDATETFTTAKDTYDEYAQESVIATVLGVDVPAINSASTTAATLISNMQTMNVSDYTAATTNYTYNATSLLGGWSNEPGTAYGESWDGTNGDTYFNEWNASARAMTQTVTLPKASYVLIAKGRASTNGRLILSDGTNTVTFPHKSSTGKGITIDGDANFDDGTYANSNNGRGWEYRFLTFDADGSTSKTFTFSWTTANSNWAGLDDITLLAIPETVTISENDEEAPIPSIADVTLTRTLTGGQWNGFSLPFSLSAEQIAASALNGATIKQWASASENVITLEDATEIVAGEPYLVKPESNIENPTFSGIIVENPSEAVMGTGDYTLQAHLYNTSLPTDGSIAYVSTTDSSIKKLTSGGIKGLRAIFNIPTLASVKALTVNFGDDTTEILSVDAEGNITESGIIYNLAGQRLSQAQKGVNIINGKKVIIK